MSVFQKVKGFFKSLTAGLSPEALSAKSFIESLNDKTYIQTLLGKTSGEMADLKAQLDTKQNPALAAYVGMTKSETFWASLSKPSLFAVGGGVLATLSGIGFYVATLATGAVLPAFALPLAMIGTAVYPTATVLNLFSQSKSKGTTGRQEEVDKASANIDQMITIAVAQEKRLETKVAVLLGPEAAQTISTAFKKTADAPKTVEAKPAPKPTPPPSSHQDNQMVW